MRWPGTNPTWTPPTHTDESLRPAIELRAVNPALAVPILSQYMETQYASELLAGGSAGMGYLLKKRVLDSQDFIDALEQVAAGGTALDPEAVTQLMGARPTRNAVNPLSPQEREVPALMAEGWSVPRSRPGWW
ncbi:hypothetical protein ACIGXM_02760 [Kitasatospora sp. NPDC052896]|uniref:hypothetical protein n=1 Tax=Kitasatospora sp. NPDC052896 TaxID=3364061 RepID=UPI0037C7749C